MDNDFGDAPEMPTDEMLQNWNEANDYVNEGQENNEPKFFKWVVEIEVEESWVADGFDMTDERAHDMLAHTLPYAYNYELKAKVISAPEAAEIRKAQGS